ncbi:inner membrane protein [Oceanisphaera litoralis]|uniref:metal-dependent hydrolase n=1 Tax=Oceanisphaera litoralis TaxID=225144 RepID=UPI00195C0026|nr:metal-dependent hydrolase [Oceanisphaera litoralis]MBM7457141.1 inner membrane protein [Oceanisphaera litoralis]
MDSLSQLSLGAAVGVAVMGKRAGVGKAALIGALFGTLPDLDVLIDYGDPVSNMTYHRGDSHSLFYLSLLSPLFAWLLCRLSGQRGDWRRWTLTLWLVLITHVLLDNMTVYGTQLARPFTDYPFGIGSVFIIDPLYTLPLLLGLTAALFRRGGRGLSANRLGLGLSSLYLCWSLLAQWQVSQMADRVLAEQGIEVERRLITPTAFNTLLWRVLVMTPDGYLEGFISLLDREPPQFIRHPQGRDLYRAWRHHPQVARLAWFSKGFFRMSERQGQLLITDLRMGQERGYSFNFVVAERGPAQQWQALDIPRQVSERPPAGLALNWLWRRALGEPLPPMQRWLDDPYYHAGPVPAPSP